MLSLVKQVAGHHFRMIVLAVLIAIAWPQIKQYLHKDSNIRDQPTTDNNGIRLLSPEELASYNGEPNSRGLYLSILGSVYDVQKGSKHYGPDGSYSFFTGRDASKSFVTGNFDQLTDDLDNVLDLTPKEILSIIQWKKFYDNEYIFIGKLVGRFYDDSGQETDYFIDVQKQQDIALEEKRRDEELKELFPPCNIEWKMETGTRVWCTPRSGGMEREWTGYPRKYYEPGASDFRCACIHPEKLTLSNIKMFGNCPENSLECFYK